MGAATSSPLRLCWVSASCFSSRAGALTCRALLLFWPSPFRSARTDCPTDLGPLTPASAPRPRCLGPAWLSACVGGGPQALFAPSVVGCCLPLTSPRPPSAGAESVVANLAWLSLLGWLVRAKQKKER